MLRSNVQNGRMLTVADGFVQCPTCRHNKKLQPIMPDTEASRLVLFCRVCKNRITVDIHDGQCFESPCL